MSQPMGLAAQSAAGAVPMVVEPGTFAMIFDFLRPFVLRVPLSIRHRIKSVLRRLMHTNSRGQHLVDDLARSLDLAGLALTRNDFVLAEQLGLFDARWYCTRYPDILAYDYGVDPFSHYMKDGWREGRKPSPNFSAEAYSQLERGFDARTDNPVLHVLHGGLGNPAVRRWLAKITPGGLCCAGVVDTPAGGVVCLIGYLRNRPGPGGSQSGLCVRCAARAGVGSPCAVAG